MIPQIALHGQWPDPMSMSENKTWESLSTVVFKEKVASNVHKAYMDLLSASSWAKHILGHRCCLLHITGSHTISYHITSNPCFHRTSWRHWGQARWRPLTPSSSVWGQILLANGQGPTHSCQTSSLANYMLPLEGQQQGSRRGTGQLLPDHALRHSGLCPLQIPGIS